MITQLVNGILVIDGLPKFCPYQQPLMQMEPQTSLSIGAQQPKITHTHQPCGEWCALFRKNVNNNQVTSVGLWCSTLKYEITEPVKIEGEKP